jgi:hypothetical protein
LVVVLIRFDATRLHVDRTPMAGTQRHGREDEAGWDASNGWSVSA